MSRDCSLILRSVWYAFGATCQALWEQCQRRKWCRRKWNSRNRRCVSGQSWRLFHSSQVFRQVSHKARKKPPRAAPVGSHCAATEPGYAGRHAAHWLRWPTVRHALRIYGCFWCMYGQSAVCQSLIELQQALHINWKIFACCWKINSNTAVVCCCAFCNPSKLKFLMKKCYGEWQFVFEKKGFNN